MTTPGDDDDVDPSLQEELAKVEAYRLAQEALRKRATDPPAGGQRPRRATKQGSVKGWAGKALDDELAIMRSTPKGQRNGQLNTSAFNLGQIVATGELQFDTVVAELRSAALATGLKASELKSWDLPERGVRKGMEEPRDTSNVGKLVSTNVIPMSKGKSGSRMPAEVPAGSELPDDDEEDFSDPDERRVSFTPLGGVKTEVPLWVWEYGGYGRIQFGALTIFAGKPAAGKSTAVRWFASMITNGTLPGVWFGTPMNVAMYSPEEGIADTLVPSLQAAGCDMNRVGTIDVSENSLETGLMSERDEERIVQMCLENDVRALFVDPVMQTFDSSLTDGHKNVEVRRALMPYARIARRIKGIVVCVHHLRKGGMGSGIMDMMNGSSAFGELARCVFGFGNVGDGINVMEQAKNSAGSSDLRVQYKLPILKLPADDGNMFELPRFEIVGPTEISLTDTGGREDEDQATTTADVAWLRQYLLENQPASVSGLMYDASKRADISKNRVYRARNKLGVKYRTVDRPDAPNTRVWYLPDYVGPTDVL